MGPDVVHGQFLFLREKVEGVCVDPHPGNKDWRKSRVFSHLVMSATCPVVG
jgi:hypothetical protein